MCLSIFLAFVIGSYLFLVSLAALVHQNRFKKINTQLLSDHLLLAITGGMSIAIGLLIVASHNIWVADWPLLITLIGWMTLLQGAARLFVPDYCAKFAKQLQAKMGYNLITWIWLLIGLYLVWAGFNNLSASAMAG